MDYSTDTNCAVSLDDAISSRRHRLALATEFLAIFFVPPLLCTLKIWPYPPLLLLTSIGVAAVIWLLWRSSFPRRRLISLPEAKRNLIGIVSLFLVAGAALTVLALLWLPAERHFYLPRTHPRVWLAFVLLYPLFSAYPQELFFRGFFFHRYRELFQTPLTMILASTLAFSFAHIIFHNTIAPALTILGGLIFGYRYYRTQSILLTSIEHALWGLLVLSIGLERYFLSLAARLL